MWFFQCWSNDNFSTPKCYNSCKNQPLPRTNINFPIEMNTFDCSVKQSVNTLSIYACTKVSQLFVIQCRTIICVLKLGLEADTIERLLFLFLKARLLIPQKTQTIHQIKLIVQNITKIRPVKLQSSKPKISHNQLYLIQK